MAYAIKLDDREAEVELLGQENNYYKIRVDDQVYEVDIEELANGIYSLILDGRSNNIEITPGATPKNYTVDISARQYDVEVIDAEARYRKNREQGSFADDEDVLLSPVPGKVIDVLAENGMEVKKGQTLVIVSAMKMESEFKAARDGVVKEVKVEKGQNVESNQILVVTE